MSVRVFAPAKINLTLQVGRPLASGRHPLQSVVTFADVGDWVEARPAGELSLYLSGPFSADLAGVDDNLVLRAAHTLARAAGIGAPRAELRLEKNVPVASGIGGGSSDAAAALKALNELWRCGLDDAALMSIASSLGGDVPVCVRAAPAYMSGEGERVTPMSLPVLDAVLINPGIAIATADVFHRFDEMQLGAGFGEAPAPVWQDLRHAAVGVAMLGNDLEPPAHACAPELAPLRALLESDVRVICAGMSGSGATMFTLMGSSDNATQLAADLALHHPTWWIRATRLGALDATDAPR